MEEYMEHDVALEKALDKCKFENLGAPLEHHGAFANAVAYLISGKSGGYGGPTCREHAVAHAASKSLKRPGQWTFEEACSFARPICYGDLTDLHVECFLTEYCFDDSEKDIDELKKLCAPIDPR